MYMINMGKCYRNCDLDCDKRYQDKPHPYFNDEKQEKDVRRRALISQGVRRSIRKRNKNA